MATKIRLQRRGRKSYAFYSIVIADARAPRDGRFTEKIGTYNPNTNPATVDLNFERALDIEVTEEAGKNLKQGIEMVLGSFYKALESVGVEEVEAEGKPFDPNFHEAYAQVPGEEGQESGVVAQVYEKGYKLHERVLRAAKVTVTE